MPVKSNACFNLGPKQKRSRVIFSLIVFVLTSAVCFWMVYYPSPSFLRFFVFPPYFISVLGFLQAKERTCVFMALDGMQDLGEGKEQISDPRAAQKLVQKSQKIILSAFALAVFLTLSFLLV